MGGNKPTLAPGAGPVRSFPLLISLLSPSLVPLRAELPVAALQPECRSCIIGDL